MNVDNIKIKTVYLDEYDVEVNKYLNPAQIQQIVNSIAKIDMWAERQENLVMMVMYHATNIEPDKLEEIGAKTIIESGLFEAVKNSIDNYHEIQEAIDYTESVTRNLGIAIKAAGPQINELFDVVIKKYGKAIIKK